MSWVHFFTSVEVHHARQAAPPTCPKLVTPATYRNRIAASLQQTTGQSFGAPKQQWLTWWREKGPSINLH